MSVFSLFLFVMEKKKTLVIGASEKIERYSNKAIRMLQEYEHPIVAYGNRKGEVNNTPITTDFPTETDFDTVTLYLGPQNQPDFYDKIVALKPKRVIFNPGTENEDFQQFLIENGIEYEEACTLVLLRSGQY